MKTQKRFTGILIFCLAIASINAAAQTSAFTYQGKLTDLSAPASGNYDFSFRLFDAASGGAQIGSDAVLDDVPVTNGIFTVSLNFGAEAFSGGGLRFLEISVRPGASTGALTLLAPLQQITSSPFSIRTVNSASANSLSGACSMCVTDAQIQTIDGSKVTGTVSNATTANNVSGIVPITNGGTGSATQNFVDLSTNQTKIGGNKSFTGVLSGNGSGLTNLNTSVNTTVVATAVALPTQSYTSVTVNCPTQFPTVTGGGYEMQDFFEEVVKVLQSRPFPGGNGWFVRFRNNGSAIMANVTVYAICAK